MSASPATRTFSSDDPRLGDWVQSISLSSLPPCRVPNSIVVVGFPYDEGTRRNGGRIGAVDGPETVRKFLHGRMGTLINPETGDDLTTIQIYDVGDIQRDLTLEQAHELLSSTVSRVLSLHYIPFIIGGSNDQSFCNYRAYHSHLLSLSLSPCAGVGVGVVNVDAHLDVRPLKEGLAHSGSPFFQMITSPSYQSTFQHNRFVEFAAQGNQCSQQHAQFVEKNMGKIKWLSQLRAGNNVLAQWRDTLNELGDHIFVSFDIDSIESGACPGVSCPGTIGLSAQEAIDMCYQAGKTKQVEMVDMSEFNPKVEDYRTARLVANMFYFFALGVSSRNAQSKQ